MSKKITAKSVAMMAGASFAVSLAASPSVMAEANPFSMTKISGADIHLASGKCGAGKSDDNETKCGDGKGKADGEGKCGGQPMSKEGKCGEGKCGGKEMGKGNEGKCGEGKCGGKN